jgi:hypothetical protein
VGPEGDAEAGGCLTFARVTPERVTKGFGTEPGSVRLVDAGSAEAALAYPVYGDDIEPASDGGEVTDAIQRAARGG